MLLSIACFTFFCELDSITLTASVIVVIEDVSDHAFDVDLLDDPLVKKACISFKSAVYLLCLSSLVWEISALSPMFESCILFLKSLHSADFPLPGTLFIQFD